MDQMNKGKGGYAAAVPKKRKPKSNENTKVVSLTVSNHGQGLRTTTVKFYPISKSRFQLVCAEYDIYITLGQY